MLLTKKKIVVTGGAGALGSAVGRMAAANGASVILLDVVPIADQDYGETVICDLLDQESVAQCFQKIGDFDVLANIAGGFDMGPSVHETTDEFWERESLFDINVKTVRRVLEAAVPTLVNRGSGSVINVGAQGAIRGMANMGAYLSSKSVVMRLTESLSEEVKEKGVNVNAVLPSIIDTPRNRSDMPGADFSKWVHPEELANVVCFLGSDNAKAIHGALIPVVGLS